MSSDVAGQPKSELSHVRYSQDSTTLLNRNELTDWMSALQREPARKDAGEKDPRPFG